MLGTRDLWLRLISPCARAARQKTHSSRSSAWRGCGCQSGGQAAAPWMPRQVSAGRTPPARGGSRLRTREVARRVQVAADAGARQGRPAKCPGHGQADGAPSTHASPETRIAIAEAYNTGAAVWANKRPNSVFYDHRHAKVLRQDVPKGFPSGPCKRLILQGRISPLKSVPKDMVWCGFKTVRSCELDR